MNPNLTTEVRRSAAPSALHPLLQRLFEKFRYPELDAADAEAFAAGPGDAVLFVTEDPVRYRETLDVAVIVPELQRACGAAFRVGVLLPPAARALQPRYGFRRWPALVFLRAGAYVGAIEGMHDWTHFHRAVCGLLAAAPCRAPGIGIPVAPTCH